MIHCSRNNDSVAMRGNDDVHFALRRTYHRHHHESAVPEAIYGRQFAAHIRLCRFLYVEDFSARVVYQPYVACDHPAQDYAENAALIQALEEGFHRLKLLGACRV